MGLMGVGLVWVGMGRVGDVLTDGRSRPRMGILSVWESACCGRGCEQEKGGRTFRNDFLSLAIDIMFSELGGG
jgi:hypothetical protein